MSLEVAVRHRQGAFTLDAAFRSEGGVTALFGRSGSGKTSLVNIIAGLVRPQQGRIVLEGEPLLDSERRLFVPKHRRRLGYVFQEARLFPHLTVRQNLLYGRWFAPRAAPGEPLEQVVELLGIGALLQRRPAKLSGGEKQRVAIGRALLAKPRLLLMDEPLASLDEARKAEILPYIERLRDETRIPIVYVSHSLAEVARLAGTVVVLAEGRVAAAGPTREVLSRLDVAPLAGRDEAGAVLEVRVARHEVEHDLTVLDASAGELRVPTLAAPPGSRHRVHILARDVMLATRFPEGLSALNVLPAVVRRLAPAEGGTVRIALDCGGQPLLAHLTRRSVDSLGIAEGRELFAVIKAVALDCTGLRRGGADASAG